MTKEEQYFMTKKESKLAQRFAGFDYKKYWTDWNKKHPNKSKEIDWGKRIGKELF